MNHILPLRDFLHEQEVSEQPYKVVMFLSYDPLDPNKRFQETEHLEMMKK